MADWDMEPGDLELDDLERELRESLQRVHAPLGFDGRVFARVAARNKRRPWRRMRWTWAVAAVLFAVTAGEGGARYEQIEYQHRAEAAHAQAVVGLRIAAAKMEMVRQLLSGREGEK